MLLRYLLIAASLALPLAAQHDGPYWNVSPMPAGGGSITAFGSNVTIQASGAVHYYSGVLRRWILVPHGPNAAVFDQYNDYAIIRDGNKVHGLSSRNPAMISTITVSAAAKIFPGPSARSWMAAVQDGKTVYGFSAFFGKWIPLTTASASATITIGGITLIVNDGVKTHAMDAYHGTWASTNAQTVVDVQTAVALALDSSSRVHAYSAHSNSWQTISFPGAASATLSKGKSFEMLTAGKLTLAFSAYPSRFAIYSSVGTSIQILTGPNVALFKDGNRVVGYAAGTGLFGFVTGTQPALEVAGRIYGSLGLVTFGDGRHYGFSGITGHFTRAPAGVFASGPKAATALGLNMAKASWGYSPIVDRWVAGPTSVPLSSHIMNESIVLVRANGYDAFSARLGKWFSRTLLGASQAKIATQGSMFTATLGNRVDIFDPRLGRWTAILAAASPTVSLWRMVALAADGRTGFGYSFFTSKVAPVALRGKLKVVRANSEIGFIQTDTHIHVFTAFGSFSTTGTFPEFWRPQVRGTDLRLLQIGRPGSAVVTMIGKAAGYLEIPPFGTLQIDPASIALIAPLGSVPASGLLDVNLAVPADPALNGQIIHLQNIVMPPSARPFLSSSLSPVIW